MGKSIHVIILAGGYNADIARGAAAAASAAAAAAAAPSGPPPRANAAASLAATSTTAQRTAASAASAARKLSAGGALLAVAAAGGAAAAAVPALIPLEGVPAVVRLLRALQSVKRVAFESVWVVHNASDEARLKGPGGLFGAGGSEADVGLPALNFLSNGATGPASWKGEAADLRSALAAIKSRSSGSGSCVAAISAELAFMPHYNLQRLLEHSYLRGRDVVGSSFLNGVDLAVLGTEGHARLEPAEDGPLPRIARVQPDSAGAPGMQVAEPYLFLRPETAAAVAGGGGGAAKSLVGLAAVLVAGGTYMAAGDLMFGRYNLRTAAAVDYADRFFAFIAAAAIDPSALGLKRDAVIQPYSPYGGDGSGAVQAGGGPAAVPAAGSFTGRSTAANFRFDELDGTARAAAADPLRGTDYAAFLSRAAAFNERFFGGGLAAASTTAPSLKQYLLPPTFYMTAYRRQAADIML